MTLPMVASKREQIRKALADAGVALAEGEWKDALLDRLEVITASEDELSNTSIGERRLTWRELVEQQRAEIGRLNGFARIVGDLDRNEHGRHEDDIDASDPSGISQGNPHIRPGEIFGYGIGGSRVYRMPPRGQRHEPTAWEARS